MDGIVDPTKVKVTVAQNRKKPYLSNNLTILSHSDTKRQGWIAGRLKKVGIAFCAGPTKVNVIVVKTYKKNCSDR